MAEETDDDKLERAYRYWHDMGFDEGFDEGYDLGYCDGWDAAMANVDAEEQQFE